MQTINWTPTRKTQLTLSQLGLGKNEINEAVNRYLGHAVRPNDQEFLSDLALYIQHVQPDRRIEERAQIPRGWRPALGVISHLEKLGYKSDAIEFYIHEFVSKARESRWICHYVDSAFTRYCLRHPPQLPKPLPPTWQPDPILLESIKKRVGCPIAYIKSRVPLFKRFIAEKTHHNWEGEFTLFINNGWSILGHREGWNRRK